MNYSSLTELEPSINNCLWRMLLIPSKQLTNYFLFYCYMDFSCEGVSLVPFFTLCLPRIYPPQSSCVSANV